MACLGAIEQLGWTLDRIVTADVWATDTIPADLPPMVEFKDYADNVIKERYGIEVEHYKSPHTFESCFYTKVSKGKPKFVGGIRGFPITIGQWCLRDLKLPALKQAQESDGIYYLGIAADEPNRFHNLTDTKLSPLVEIVWTEADCRAWCEQNDLLSPIYTQTARGGCWFCHNQGVGQLRLLRKQYPELWALLLKWDSDSPCTFHADGHTVHDFDKRFAIEEEVTIDRFRWGMITGEIPIQQSIFDIMKEDT